MDTATVISMALGIVALAISLYGVYERRASAAHQVRSQLVDVLDQLQEMVAKEIELYSEPSGPSTFQALAVLNEHRALLAEQAAALDTMLHGRGVAANEYACLASAFAEIGDLDGALAYWRRATTVADQGGRRPRTRPGSGPVPSVVRAACWRGQAECLAAHGLADESSRALRTALDATPATHDRGHYDRVLTLLDWRSMEMNRPSTGGPSPEELVRDARTWADRIGDPGLREHTVGLIDEAVGDVGSRPGNHRRRHRRNTTSPSIDRVEVSSA